MKRTGISGMKFSPQRGRFGALSAVAVLMVIPMYGDRDAGARDLTTMAPASAANARVGALFKGISTAGTSAPRRSFRVRDATSSSPPRTACPRTSRRAARPCSSPAYRDGTAPYGTWPVETVYADDAWNEDGDQDSDVAFAVLGPGSDDGKKVEDVVGGAPLFAGRMTGKPVTVTGYPGDTEYPQVCTNTADAYGDKQQRIDCPDFPGGTSGSPWAVDGGAVAGVIGGYEFGGDDPDVSYSIVFGQHTKSLYKLAESAGDPRPVAPEPSPTPAAAPEPAAAGGDVTSDQAITCACLLP